MIFQFKRIKRPGSRYKALLHRVPQEHKLRRGVLARVHLGLACSRRARASDDL